MTQTEIRRDETSQHRWREHGGADVIAGLTVAVMLVPQAMAYASLAGLPPVVGLYASVFPLVAYALVGSSSKLAVGPVAMDSLLVATGVGALAAQGSADYLRYAVLLAGMVGGIHLALSAFRPRIWLRLLSTPVIGGFTSGAAILIALSQSKHLLGVEIARGGRLHDYLRSLGEGFSETNPPTLLLGSVAVALLVALKRWAPRVPRALVVVALGTTVTYLFGLDARGVSVVGHVPAGLPRPAFPTATLDELGALLPTALAIAVVAIAEAFSVAQVYARRDGETLAPRRELIGLGAANLVGALFGGYPVTGGLSRTAVNAGAGAATRLAGVVTATAVAISLLLLTSLFRLLPNAVLAAIVIAAVVGLVDLEGLRTLWRDDRPRALVFTGTALAVLFIGIVQGIGAGVVADSLVRRARRAHASKGLSVDAEPLEPAPKRRATDAE